MTELRVAYVSTYDAASLSHWSGSGYFIAEALKRHVGSLDYLSLVTPSPSPGQFVKKAWHTFVARDQFFYQRSLRVARSYAEQTERFLAQGRYDVVIGPGTLPFSLLRTSLPVISWGDATFAAMDGYYYPNLAPETRRMGHQLEKLALEKLTLAVYASQWAADSAVRDYGLASARVRVVPFGANIPRLPEREETERPPGSPVHLLFVGKEWERKGGAIAVETLQALLERGIAARLTVVGCVPPAEFLRPEVTVHPFLDKQKPAELALLDELYRSADFCLVPSRQECYGLVFCEANAYGVPDLAARTGGIPTIVEDGVNGFLLPLEARGAAYAAIVERAIADPEAYRRLRASARARYEARLNWDVAGRAFSELILAAIESPGMLSSP